MNTNTSILVFLFVYFLPGLTFLSKRPNRAGSRAAVFLLLLSSSPAASLPFCAPIFVRMRFATVAEGVGAIDARRTRGEHDVLLDFEDKPLLIRAAIPEVGAVMRELDGVWRVPYDAALFVAAGFVEAPLRAPAMPKRLWGELCLAPHRLQAAWRAALPLVFAPDATLLRIRSPAPPFASVH